MLVVDNLTYSHKEDHEESKSFCYNLSFEKIHTIREENGWGKSTLMDLIAGFLKPQKGAIKWQGQSLLSLSTKKRPVSYLMQAPVFFPLLSVIDTLHLSGALKSECIEALNGFDVSFELDQKMTNLSGGQRQLVMFLQCLLQKRDIVLLDEPFSAMDLKTEAKTKHYLEKHQSKTGAVVLMSDHSS